MSDACSRLSVWWHNTHQMPFLLRMYCQGGMVVGPLLFVWTLLPIGDVSVNGKQVSRAEFWASGAGFTAAILTFMVTAGCWGLAARSLRSRWLLVLCPVIPLVPVVVVSPGLLGAPASVTLVVGAFTAALLYFCLFRLRSVLDYLETQA